MLNSIIRFALQQRLLVVALALLVILYGAWQTSRLPIDVLPDLDRPRVTVMTEAPGLAPEEVETLITFPMETALNGATGVQAVRTESGVGLSVIYVEFDWGTDIYDDRQIVAERLALVAERLPPGVTPQLAPVSSVMGQIMIIGMYSVPNEKTFLFRIDSQLQDLLGDEELSGQRCEELLEELRGRFKAHDVHLSEEAGLIPEEGYGRWLVSDPAEDGCYALLARGEAVEVHRTTSPMELRTLADWVVRQRLLTIGGVSQVFVMGGQRKQFQVLVDPNALLREGVTLHEVETAVKESNQNATGGYLDDQGPNELLVRSLGRIRTVGELEDVVVKFRDRQAVLLRQVARVIEGPQVKRGDSAAFVRGADGTFAGGSAVVLTINKQPKADTRQVSEEIAAALEELQASLPEDVRINTQLYQQKAFIDLAIENVTEALLDGGLLVVVILFLFLLNFRTTFITLTAIPLSILVTALVFKWFDLSINTMTLGGLAVAIGELVDDAIVGVENVFRRLRENRLASSPKPALLVVFQASVEIRNPIIFGTAIVVLVFLPVFGLSGMAGRLYTPLGIAYIVSILSSLLVSLTLTPVLSYWLLAHRAIWPRLAAVLSLPVGFALSYWVAPQLLAFLRLSGASGWVAAAPIWHHVTVAVAAAPLLWAAAMLTDRFFHEDRDGLLLRMLKRTAAAGIRVGLAAPIRVLLVAFAVFLVSGFYFWRLESDFLPPFNEGVVQLNVILKPGTSLKTSTEVAQTIEGRLQEIEDLAAFVRKTGRAELDEHAVTVNFTEFIASFNPHTTRSREEIIEEIRQILAEVPGTVIAVDQPLQHLISHTLSGVRAQVAVKLYGNDLEVLRETAQAMKAAIAGVEGVKDLQVEPQDEIPQLRIEIQGHKLKQFGLRRAEINEFVETAMHGRELSEVLQNQRTFDLLVRMDEPHRENLQQVERLSIDLPDGGTTKLDSVAAVYEATGPNKVKREQVRRRIVLQCNTAGRGLVDVVRDIKARLAPIEKDLQTGYFIEYGGQFESQQSATRVIAVLFAVSLVGMFLVLYSMFGSANLSLQVMVALPMAFIGSVAALYVTGQTLTVAAMVGFISLCGIASRNGILLISHYLHLVEYEGQTWTREMIVRAGQQRLAPVLMTAMTSGIGLVPLAMAAGQPGKEILYPVATVIIGGLVSSTLLEFLVRPAVFWRFGLGAARRVVDQTRDEIPLVEESPAENQAYS